MAEVDSAWAIALGDAIRRSLGERPQRWLAAATHLDPATISKIVRGQQPPSLDQIDAIAHALGMTRRALLSVAGYVEADTNGLIDIATLPPWANRAVRAILLDVEKDQAGSPDSAP